MLIRSLLGLAALLAGTSCVPAPIVQPTRQVAAITPSEANLLHRLALTTPDAMTATTADILRPPATPLTAAPPFAAMARRGDDAARAVGCLTAAVYYEARSEPADGQRAVAQVVLNRVRDRAFPGSVCGVVYQRSPRGCQFSFACDGSTSHAIDPAAWGRARAVADAAYGGAVYAPVGAATYYHTAAISPWWASSLSRIGQIGAHVFYGWRRAMANVLTFRRSYAGIEPGASPQMTQPSPDDGATVAGVTIHRGGGEIAEDGAGEAPGSVVMAAGVRIHRRAEAAIFAGGAAHIGPESDERPVSADAS
jgi:hypothetical protein